MCALKILVVDDSAAMRRIARRVLSRLDRVAGATILEAADGTEAFDVALAERPDLVLSDWHMPEMTGIELLQALNDEGLRPTFGFVTSQTSAEVQALAHARGAHFLLAKPVTVAALDQALHDVF